MHTRSLTEYLYRHDLDRLERSRPSDCAHLLPQAMHNQATKDFIIQSLLPAVFQSAMRYSLQCGMEAMELVAIGNATLIEQWQDAQTQAVPLRYLLNLAKMAMIGYVRQYGHGPITFPDRGSETAPEYLFLPIHIALDGDERDMDEPERQDEATGDMTPLYEALSSLKTEQARTLITQLFGLFGQARLTLTEVAGGDSKTKEYSAKKTMLHKKLKAMKTYLIEHYPDFVERHASADPDEQASAKAYARLYEIGTIPQATRTRLDAACERILERGQAVTIRSLLKEARAGSSAIAAYLYEKRIQHT